MVWKEPENQVNGCYSFLVNVTRMNRKNSDRWIYPVFSFCKTSNPSLRGRIPTFHQLPELCENEYCLSDDPSETNEGDCDFELMLSIPHCFN